MALGETLGMIDLEAMSSDLACVVLRYLLRENK